MVLIREVNIREFRGIRETREPIRLSKFNVLIGRNNSGKSAILEALSFFPIPFREYSTPFVGVSRLEFISKLHGGYDSLIYGYSGISEIKFMLNNAEVIYRITDKGNVFATINGEELGSEDYVRKIASIFGFKTDKGYVEKLSSLVAFIPNDTQFIRSLSGSIISAWNFIMKSGANVRIVRDLVSKVVHDRFTELFLGAERTLMLRKELPDDKIFWIKVIDIGDGIERALITALYLEALQPKLVLWDDFEASAHPGLIEVLIEWLASKDWQVVISTHSIDVLDRITKIDPEGTSILALKNDEYDRLSVRLWSVDELSDAFERNVDIRSLLDLI